MATCPECDAELELDDDDIDEMEVGDPWDCEACGSHLRVASIDPLEFDADEEDDEESDDDEAEGDEEDSLDDGLEDDEESDDDGDWEE